MTESWKTVVGGIASVILLGIVAFLLFLIIWSVILRNSPCQDSSTCSVYQTCDSKTHRCKSLPGSKCNVNSDCSAFAPICQPHDHYCTNFSTQARGTAGNPPASGLSCGSGLVLNTTVNLCQQSSIGAQCSIDAQCNLGVCDNQSRTCQYATTRCTTSTALNPHQCADPFQCDATTFSCTIPGTTPGSDGTPCNSTADCSRGSFCVSGPPGSGFSGVCRTGDTTWLMSLTDGSARCITPLAGGDTSWCRYDINNFMSCQGIGQCQYPYASCNTGKSLCEPEGGPGSDPIKVIDFTYEPVGFSPQVVKGAFYTPSYPTVPPGQDDATGGKLLDPYYGFLAKGLQFADQAGFKGGQLVTFTRLTSFTVASMAIAAVYPAPPVPPQIPYYTAVFQDPHPILVMTTILTESSLPGQSRLYFSFYRQNFSIPNFINNFYIWVGNVSFPTTDSRLWNPSAINSFNPSIVIPKFVANPIITPWIGVTNPGSTPSNQDAMVYSLIYAGDSYRMGFMLLDINIYETQTASSMHIISIKDVNNKFVPLSPDQFLVTSWDAITTWNLADSTIHTTLLLYGLPQDTATYQLIVSQIQFTIVHDALLPQVTTGSVDGVTMIPAFGVTLPSNVVSSRTQCRLSRTEQQSAEPLLLLTCFYEGDTGLKYTTFAIKSSDENFLFNSPCTGDFNLPGVTTLFYVTPITGAYNYGCFVVWCETGQTRSAFLIVQVHASCNLPSSSKPFSNFPVFSAVYWRRLTSDPEPDDYYLYPVGGGSLPYFLATDDKLTFDGIPSLP